MKKFAALFLAGMIALSLAACGSSSGTTSTTTTESASSAVSEAAEAGGITTVSAGELHMATNAAFPPYEMTSDDGGYEGIDVEAATKIAEKLGLPQVSYAGEIKKDGNSAV